MAESKRKRYRDFRSYLAARRRRGATQKVVASELRISPGHLSDLKNGNVRPSFDLAMRLSEEGVPIESFR